ncbi:MAG: SGNH/GDSL hydrolase family protein [Planctomycetaceae bacterium]|nr:SGNH/GDSL hydrolase family protein [Planctomycetaceae bacterium]
MLSLVRWCAVLLGMCGAGSVQAAEFFFKDGDVVVMIGDSITEQHLYSNFVEMWTVTRFPQWKLTFRNVGIGGDSSGGGNSRFARDVLLHKPTAMTVDFGMNDGRYRAFGEDTFKPYMDGLQGMADKAKAANIRTAWATPQPLDNGDQGPTALVGYNQTLEKFSEGVKTIADQNGGLFVDQFHPYLAALDRARGKGPKYDRITGGDAVHPGPPGQALMAASILKGLSFPSLVSSVEIDAAGKVTAAANCKVDLVTAKDGGVSFSRLDGALPFYPAEAVSILPWAPILEDLNDYRLKVTGLAAGKYEVRIGGKKVAELTAEQLAAGANLAAGALADGPIAEQVKAVRTAVEAKNRFHHDLIFRGVVLSNVPEWIYAAIPRDELETKKKAIIDERLAKLPALDADVAKTLVMKANVFEIVPVK